MAHYQNINLTAAADLYFCTPRNSTLIKAQLVTASNFGIQPTDYFTVTVFGNDGLTAVASHSNQLKAYTGGIADSATLVNTNLTDYSRTQGCKVTCVLNSGPATIDGNLILTFDDARAMP